MNEWLPFMLSLSSEKASNLGNFCTGLAALATVIIAAYGVFHEVRHWHKRNMITKEAEVAGRVLFSAIRVLEALDFLSSPVLDITESSPELLARFPKTHLQRENFRYRIEATQPDVNDFIKAQNEAQVYLEDGINLQLGLLWKRWIDIKVDFQMHMLGLDQGASGHADILKAYSNVFGAEGRAKNAQLKNSLMSVLKPLARMEKLK
jgi:hypothetical protein